MEEPHIGYMIKQVDDRLQANGDAAFRQYGLTFAQSRVLAFLAHNGDQATQKDLERHLHVAHPTVAGIVARMEDNGFLTHSADPRDRRNKIIRLTPQAQAMQYKMRDLVMQGEARMIKGLTAEDVIRLQGYLRKMYDNLQ